MRPAAWSVPFGVIVVISPAGQGGAAFIVLDNLDEFPQLGQFLIRVPRGLYRLFFHREGLLSNLALLFLSEQYANYIMDSIFCQHEASSGSVQSAVKGSQKQKQPKLPGDSPAFEENIGFYYTIKSLFWALPEFDWFL